MNIRPSGAQQMTEGALMAGASAIKSTRHPGESWRGTDGTFAGAAPASHDSKSAKNVTNFLKSNRSNASGY